jgi:hypothetical protein
MTMKYHECKEMDEERCREEAETGYRDDDWHIEVTFRPVLSWGMSDYECGGYFVINYCPFCGEKLNE